MSLTLKPRQAVEEEIENWDDDDLDIGGDDFTFRSASITTTATNAPSHRDSVSSRLSIRSDLDGNGGDEERELHLPSDDQRSTNDAIAAATRAGIPIPHNVPSSALMGGTIKRLGGRKIKKIIQQDDWDEEIELPGQGGLQIKQQDASRFPDALRQVSGPSSALDSPAKRLQAPPTFNLGNQPTLRSKPGFANLNLDRFRDEDDFGDDFATIKVAKRTTKPMTTILPPRPQKNDPFDDDNFEAAFQLPSNDLPLRLSTRKDIPKTPVSAQDEFDEWGEGSLGTRIGGTRRDRTSNRSSSSALSPSVSSSFTAESEDDGLDGLVLPTGPIKFDEILKKRIENRSPEHEPVLRHPVKRAQIAQDKDFLTGLEIGDGDVFDSSKLSFNRNIKVKNTRQTSPQRPKTAVALVFTNKPAAPAGSRLPRPLGGHERVPSSLAPVSESGGPIPARNRRSQSRIGGHSSQSSITSIPTPTTPCSTQSMPPSTPRRRELAQKSSVNALRNEPTTTNAQLLKLKRSMPIMRSHTASPAKPMASRYERPPSRTDSSRPTSMSRPKTPVDRDRSGAESSMSYARKNPLPFLPAGNSTSQSHHITIKTSRHFRRHDSEGSNNSADFRPSSRTVSRSTIRSPSPTRSRLRGAEALAREAASKRQITKPVRRRHFGDGFELDGFDDLPTSQNIEQKFVKQPVARGAPKSLLRNQIANTQLPERTVTPAPLTPFSPAANNLPRFARDTNASRMAREQVLSQRQPSAGAHLHSQYRAQAPVKPTVPLHVNQPPRLKKAKSTIQQKPHLIKPMGSTGKASKSLKGMVWNPESCKWEGNENDLSLFESAPVQSPSGLKHSTSISNYREKENTTPRPALITNINASQGVQVVGGMVFDPQKMCWLKLPPSHTKGGDATQHRSGSAASGTVDTMDGFDAFDDDEEDVFKDVPDLEDKKPSPSKEEFDGSGSTQRKSGGEAGSLKDDWLVGEEFDVGPEFVRRQREEEERWRRKCASWVGWGETFEAGGEGVRGGEWRWRIRDVVNEL